MSSETLARLLADVYATEYAERKAWAQLQDETKFFSKPRARADHDVWSKVPFWSLDEATALSLDKGFAGRFCELGEKTGIDLPTGLTKAVRAAVQRIEDRESIISEREELRAEVQNLKAELEAQRPDPRPQRAQHQKILATSSLQRT